MCASIKDVVCASIADVIFANMAGVVRDSITDVVYSSTTGVVCANVTGVADMENVLSVQNAARVNFRNWSKMLPLVKWVKKLYLINAFMKEASGQRCFLKIVILSSFLQFTLFFYQLVFAVTYELLCKKKNIFISIEKPAWVKNYIFDVPGIVCVSVVSARVKIFRENLFRWSL